MIVSRNSIIKNLFWSFFVNNSVDVGEEPFFRPEDFDNNQLSATSIERINSITVGFQSLVNSTIKIKVKITGTESNIVFLNKELNFEPNKINHFEEQIFVER